MRQTLLTLMIPLLALSAFTLPALAQPGEGGFTGPEIDGPPGRHGRHDLRIIPGHRVLVEVLGFSDEQLAQVEELAEAIKAAVGPLREEMRILAADLQAELNAEEPEPFTVGTYLIQLHTLRQELGTLAQDFKDDFLNLLTGEQLLIYEEWQDRPRDRPRRRGRRGDRMPRPDAPEI